MSQSLIMSNAAVRIPQLALISVVAFAVLFLAGCGNGETVETACEDGGEPWTEYRLFLGRNVGDAERVSDGDWETFLADTITPRFPDGLTVLDGAGQWRGGDGVIVRERSKLLLVLTPPDAGAIERINEISAEYKRQFQQESALRVVTGACVTFQ